MSPGPKKPPPEPIVPRPWEQELRLTASQLAALERGATVRASTTKGQILLVTCPSRVEEFSGPPVAE